MPCSWGGHVGKHQSRKEAEEAGKLWVRAFLMVSMGRSGQI